MPPPAMRTVMLRPSYCLRVMTWEAARGQLRRRPAEGLTAPGYSTERWRGTEEAGDLDQPAIGTDFAKIDRSVPAGAIRAHQAPEEADQIVMHVDAAHELGPRAGPA